jgi:hypothetical protein
MGTTSISRVRPKNDVGIKDWLSDGDILPSKPHTPHQLDDLVVSYLIPTPKSDPALRRLTTLSQQLQSELWAAWLGHCEDRQLQVLHKQASGLPSKITSNPFHFIDHKVQAQIHKQPSGQHAVKPPLPGQRFFMDFRFMQSSTSNFSCPNLATDWMVCSLDGFNSYLLIVDELSRYCWVFLCSSKEPPINEISAFLNIFGWDNCGIIRCNQGGELAELNAFVSTMLENFNNVLEPTGADSPSQNGGIECFNQTLGAMTHCLLYGASLSATYWSYALVHVVYLLNCLVHSRTKRTPYKVWWGTQLDLSHLWVFGSQVCVKRTGHRHSKLDCHDFSGIFLGFTARDNNIIYMDLVSIQIKSCHHVYFDEAWYLQSTPHQRHNFYVTVVF